MSFIPNKNQNLFNFLRFSSDSQVREHETQPIELSDLSESDTNIFNIKEYCNSLAEETTFNPEEQEYLLNAFQEASIECENNPNKESILYCNENKNDEFDAKNEQYSSADINNSSKESCTQIARNIFGKIKEIKINDKIYDLSKYTSSRTKSGNKKYILNNSEETPYFFIHKNGDIEIRQYLDNGYYGEKYNAQGELIQIDPLGEGSDYIAVKSTDNGIYLDESGRRYYRNKDGYFEAEKGLPVTSTLTETGDTKISLNNETTIIFQGLIEENGYCNFEGTLKNGNYAKTGKDDDGNIIITEYIKEIGTIEKTISQNGSFTQITRDNSGNAKEININGKIYDLSQYTYSETSSGNERYLLNNSEKAPYFFIHKNGDIEIRQYLDNGYYGEKYNAQGELIQIDPLGEGSDYITVKSTDNGIYLDESGRRYYRNKDGYFEAEKGLPVTTMPTKTGDTKINIGSIAVVIFQGHVEENDYFKFEGMLENGNYAKISKDKNGNVIVSERIKGTNKVNKTTYSKNGVIKEEVLERTKDGLKSLSCKHTSSSGTLTYITKNNSGNAKEININGKIYDLSQYTYSETSSGNETYLLNNSEEAPYFFIHKNGNIEIRQYLDNGYYAEKYNAQGELIQIDPLGEGSDYITVKSAGNEIYLDESGRRYYKNKDGYYEIKKGEQIDSETTEDKTTVLKINKDFSLKFDTSVKQDENGIYKGYLLNGDKATIYKNENGETTVIQTSEHFITTTIYSNNTYAKITKNKDDIIVEININGKLYDLSDYTHSATKNEYRCDSNGNKNNKPSFFINDYTGNIEIQHVINEEYYKEIYDKSGNLIKINPLGKGDTYYSVKPNENGIYVDKYCTEYIPNSNGLYEAHPSELEELANYINETLNNKNDSATEEISKNVFEKINNENISTFMYWYKKNAENDIITDLFNSEILHRKEKNKLLKHITDCLIEYAENKGAYTEDITHELKKIYKGKLKDLDSLKSAVSTLNQRITMISSADDTINGEIDKNFKQGQIGDCYLLAAINSIANTPNGYKILKNSIEILKNNSIKVTLKGVNKEYIISQEELNYTDEYSTGDMDVRAIEIALEKHYKKSNKTIENGGHSKYILEILSGKKIDTDIIQFHSSEYEKLEEVFENLKNENFVCTAGTGSKKSNTTAYEIESRKNVNIASNHEYSILYTDDKYVYIQNPWDTSKTLKMTFDEFEKSFTSVTILNLD